MTGGPPGAAVPRRLIGPAAVLVAVTALFDCAYLARVGTIPGEEHFALGEHLHATGVLSIDDAPSVFRPPGFPVLVAAVLATRDALSPGFDGRTAVAIAHGVLLSLGALAIFLYLARRRPLAVAWITAAIFAIHPSSLILARWLTYPLLHVVCITLATLATASALDGAPRRARYALAAGALWGVTTLVRPVSLILPPFILLLARWTDGERSWRRSLRFASLFAAGMALVIAPYTVRNYRVTHRLVVVNAQEGFSFWALSATRDPAGDGAAWNVIWKEEGEPLFNRVAGTTAYSIEALYARSLVLNDAFRAQAARNTRRDPGRVAANILRNIVVFNTDTMSWWVDQTLGGTNPRTASVLKVLAAATLLLGLLGLARGLHEGITLARVAGVVYLMFCLAHSLGLMLGRYNYVRLPLALLVLPMAFGRYRASPAPDEDSGPPPVAPA